MTIKMSRQELDAITRQTAAADELTAESVAEEEPWKWICEDCGHQWESGRSWCYKCGHLGARIDAAAKAPSAGSSGK